MRLTIRLACCLAAAAVYASAATAAVLYSESFNSSSADVKILSDSDTPEAYVDYSNFTVGATNFAIPEAPRMIGGSAATRGILLRANVAAGAAQSINVLAGATPLVFSGDYRASFDAWLNISDPIPGTGSTEQLLYGIGAGGIIQNSRHLRSAANSSGHWGQLATENGYGSEDFSFNNGGTNVVNMGDTASAANTTLWNSTFTTSIASASANKIPGNSWVRVDVSRLGGTTTVRLNGNVFTTQALALASGAAYLGYEDPFASSSSAPDYMWGLFDNFVVQPIPEPPMGALALVGSLCLAAARRRR